MGSISAGTTRANRTTLARAKIDPALTRLSGLQVLFQVNRLKSGGQHFGSRLLWLPDGTLLMSIGDGGNPPTKLDGRYIRENAQDLAAHLLTLMTDRELRTKMGEAGRRRVVEHFDYRRVAKRLVRLLSERLGIS